MDENEKRKLAQQSMRNAFGIPEAKPNDDLQQRMKALEEVQAKADNEIRGGLNLDQNKLKAFSKAFRREKDEDNEE